MCCSSAEMNFGEPDVGACRKLEMQTFEDVAPGYLE
jgi:hypothetical protein